MSPLSCARSRQSPRMLGRLGPVTHSLRHLWGGRLWTVPELILVLCLGLEGASWGSQPPCTRVSAFHFRPLQPPHLGLSKLLPLQLRQPLQSLRSSPSALRMAGRWRWDLRTGKEIGGEARDLLETVKKGVEEEEGDGDKPPKRGTVFLRFLHTLSRRRIVRLLGAVLLGVGAVAGGRQLGGRLSLLKHPGGGVILERFVRPPPALMPEDGEEAMPTPPPSQEPEKPAPAEETRQRWTPFRDLKKKVTRGKQEVSEGRDAVPLPAPLPDDVPLVVWAPGGEAARSRERRVERG